MIKEKRGKLIVIEGTDGSGKATQVKALKKKFDENRHAVHVESFPKYHTETGKLVKQYLNGKFGNPVSIPPKIASLLYAKDREAAKKYIVSCLNGDIHVICDRYIGSNLAHQGAKLEGKEREEFVEWCEKYEFEELGIPKPDLTICLNLHPEHARKAMEKEKKEKDGHESDFDYQKRVVDTYLWLANIKEDWVLIGCMDGERRKTIEELTEEIWPIIKSVLS